MIGLAVEIQSRNDTYRFSSQPVRLNGVDFEERILSYDYGAFAINPDSFNSQIQSIQFSLSNPDFIPIEDLRNSVIFVYLFSKFDRKTEGRESIYYRLGSTEYDKFRGRVSNVTFADNVYNFSVSFLQEGTLVHTNQKFNLMTYARYLTASIEPLEFRTYVPVPDFSNQGIIKIGRFSSASNPWYFDSGIGENAYIVRASNHPSRPYGPMVRLATHFPLLDAWLNKGINSWGTYDSQDVLPYDLIYPSGMKICVPMTDYIFNRLNQTSLGRIDSIEVKNYENWLEENYINGRREIENTPPGRLVDNDNGTHGQFSVDITDTSININLRTLQDAPALGLPTITPSERDDNRMGYGAFELNRIPTQVNESEGYIILYRIINENLAELDTDLRYLDRALRDSDSIGLLAPVAFAYSQYKTYLERPTAEFDNEDSDIYGFDPDPRLSFISFEIDGVVDLTEKFGYRVTSPISFSSSSGEAFQMYLAQADDPGNVEEKRNMFDPELIIKDLFKMEGTGNTFTLSQKEELEEQVERGLLNPAEWMVAVVPATTFLKKFRTSFENLDLIDPKVLKDQRIDIITFDNSNKEIVDIYTQSFDPNDLDEPTTNDLVDQYEVQYENIFELAQGQFGFIDNASLQPIPNTPGIYNYVIELNDPGQADPYLGIPIRPNTITRFSVDAFTNVYGLIALRGVPENIQSEGGVIPVCYGYLERFPAIHSISRKASFDGEFSAGDDTYTICSNPITATDSNSVVVYWGLDQFVEAGGRLALPGSEIETFRAGLDKAKKYWLQNPFPPFIITENALFPTTPLSLINSPIKPVVKRIESNPYHYLVSVADNFGNIHTGIKLRGDEYLPSRGERDPRWLIRNGLGNQNIFVTFNGMPDDSFGTVTGIPNAPITHPAHILLDLLLRYGNLDDPYDQIDFESFYNAYNQEPELFLGVYLNQDTFDIWQIAESIARHSFVYLTYHNNKFSAHVLNLDSAQTPKMFFNDRSNMGGINATEFYPGYNKIVFKYLHNFVSERFDRIEEINPKNNQECYLSYQKTYSDSSLDVDLPYCFSEVTKNKILKRYAQLFCLTRTQISWISPLTPETLRLNPFDVVSVTAREAYDYARGAVGHRDARFLVTSLEPGRDSVTIRAIQLKGG